jgi:hypothetical protein
MCCCSMFRDNKEPGRPLGCMILQSMRQHRQRDASVVFARGTAKRPRRRHPTTYIAPTPRRPLLDSLVRPKDTATHPKLLLDLGDEAAADRPQLRHLHVGRVRTCLTAKKPLDGLRNGELLFQRGTACPARADPPTGSHQAQWRWPRRCRWRRPSWQAPRWAETGGSVLSVFEMIFGGRLKKSPTCRFLYYVTRVAADLWLRNREDESSDSRIN